MTTQDMTLNEYQKLAMRTNKSLEHSMALIHAALGLTSDAGEVATAIKAHVIYGKPLDTANLIEELGDTLWFIQLAAKTVNVTLEQVAMANIQKLQKRYPEKYTDEAAIARADKIDVGTGG